MKLEHLNYRAFRTWVTKAFGFCINLHPFFVIKAWLKLERSLKPMPPQIFAWHNRSHLAQWMLLWSSELPHQNLLIAFWISLQMLRGILKTLIAYLGMAWAIALISTSFPPQEKNLLCQLVSLLRTLNLMSLKKLIFLLPTIDGSPRYFSCFDTMFKLKMLLISSIYPWLMLMLKNIEDFS